MSSPRRRVVIRMTARDVTDSPNLLSTVADVFQEADFEIDLSQNNTDSFGDSEEVEDASAKLVQETSEKTKDALDLQDQAIREGIATADTADNAKSKTRTLLKVLREESLRVTVRTVLADVLDHVRDFFV